MAKIAISLPDEIFQDIERARQATGETRSEFLRRAVDALLRNRRECAAIERYIRGYQEFPETEEEIAVAQSTRQRVLAQTPWEMDDSSESR